MEKAITFKERMQNILKWIYSKLNIFLYCYLGVVVFVVLFLFNNGIDAPFHIQRFDAVIQEFANYGISAIPTRIYHVTCSGYGYASPLFYGDIFMWPFAGLCALFNIPAIWGYKIMLASTFVAVFFVAKYSFSLVVNKKYITLVFFFYVFNRIVFDNIANGYLGRAYAMMFIPLTICSFVSLMTESDNCLRNSILMGVGVAGLLFSNAIDAVIVVFALLILFLFSVRALNWKKVGFLGLSVVVFVFVSAWFLFPMLEQMSSQTFFYNSENVKQLNDLKTRTVPFFGIFINSGLLYKILQFMGKDPEFMSYFSGLIYYILIISFLLFYIIKFRKDIKNTNNSNDKTKIDMMFGVLILLFGFSLFQTKLFPHDLLRNLLAVMQFPSRAANVMALLAAIAIFFLCGFSRKKGVYVVLGVVLTLFNLMTMANATMSGIKQLKNTGWDVQYDSNCISLAEYLPEELMFGETGSGANGLWDDFIAERGDVVICSDKDVSLNSEKTFDKVTITFTNNNNNSTFELPYFYYKGYAAVNTATGEEYEVKKSKNGLVEVTGLPESGTVEVYYKGTTIQTVSEIVSGVGIVAIVGTIIFIVVKNKRNKRNINDCTETNDKNSIET